MATFTEEALRAAIASARADLTPLHISVQCNGPHASSADAQCNNPTCECWCHS